jgi:hypothetical protein
MAPFGPLYFLEKHRRQPARMSQERDWACDRGSGTASKIDKVWLGGRRPGRLSTEVKRSKRSAASHEGDK